MKKIINFILRAIKLFFKVVFFPLKLISLGLIYFYKFFISPFLPHCCIYSPSCSTYTLLAIKRFGVFKGARLGIKRILRCTPNNEGGLDRVPENLKGEFKWLI